MTACNKGLEGLLRAGIDSPIEQALVNVVQPLDLPFEAVADLLHNLIARHLPLVERTSPAAQAARVRGSAEKALIERFDIIRVRYRSHERLKCLRCLDALPIVGRDCNFRRSDKAGGGVQRDDAVRQILNDSYHGNYGGRHRLVTDGIHHRYFGNGVTDGEATE